MTSIRLIAFGLFVSVATSVFGQLPQTRMTSVFPPGAKQGTVVDVTIGGGVDLDEVDQMVFSHPGITAAAKKDANGNPVANTFTVTVAPEVPPGLYDVRCRGLFGISNPRLFRVDTLPEVSETEPNNAAAQAMPVAPDSIVNARANGGTDVDFYRIPVKAGQTLVIRSEAARLDSTMQPLLQLFNSSSKRLIEARRIFSLEASLIWTSTQDEELVLRVQDAVYSGGDQFVYRLAFDSRPIVDWISPPFVAGNAPSRVMVFGRNLPGGQPTDRKLNGHVVYQKEYSIVPAAGSSLTGASATSAFADSFWWNGVDGNLVQVGRSDRVAVSEATDVPEQPVTAPFEATGSFAERGDEDAFRFDARKGESWVIEVFAQRLGSIADPLLMVERVITNADGTVTYNRLATEDDDRQNPGGAELPTLSDDPSFRLDVPEDGTYRVRLRDRYNEARGDARLQYRLSVRQPKPDYSLVVLDAFPSADGKAPPTSGAASLRKGGSYELTVYAYRRDGHSAAIELSAENLPAGILCRPTVIGPGQVSVRLVLAAAPDAAEQIAPIRIVGRSGEGDAAIVREARVATLVHDAINGMPRTARLTESLVAGVMKDEQPFSIVVDSVNATFSQDQQLLIPVKLIKRGGFDGKVDLTFYNVPGETDAPPFAIEPGKDSALARIYFKEKAPVSMNTILLQGTSTVPYRRNPWLAERAKQRVTDAEAAVVANQTKVTTSDAALKEAQQKVVALNEAIKKIGEELAAYATQQQKLRDEFAKAVGDQKASLEALAKAQTLLTGIKAAATSSPEELAEALTALKEASTATEEAAKKVEGVNSAAATLAKQVAEVKEMEATKAKEKTAAETDVATKMKEVETAQAALTAAQKEVEAATAAKTAADAELKKAEDATKPNNIAVRAVSEPLVIRIADAPAKIGAAVPDNGAIKKGASAAVKVTVTRKNNFAGAMKVTLVLPDGVTSLSAAAVDLPADQNETTLTINAAADAAPGDIANVVIRATGEFNGRQASTDIPVAVKIVE